MRRLVAVSLLLWSVPLDAQAYIDPGTGSYLVQAIVAAVMGSAMAVKLYWRRIKAWLSGRSASGDEVDGPGPNKSGDA
jgi:hypothetical protein